MSRSLLIAATLALFAGPIVAAPVPKSTFPDFYPTRVGTKWVYAQDDDIEIVEEIFSAEVRDKAIHLGVRLKNGPNQWEKALTVSREGVLMRTNNGFAVNQWALRFPVRAGTEWEVTPPRREGLVGNTGRLTVGEEETIEVPAGTFRVVPVVFTVAAQNGVTFAEPKVQIYRYAPRVGLVELRYDGKRRVLKSFTPGPK